MRTWLITPFYQTFDPKKRVTVEEALAHPYLEAYVCVCLTIPFRLFPTVTCLSPSMIQKMSQSLPHLTLNFSSLIVSPDVITIPYQFSD
jgi:hypothetical protein